MFSVDPLAQLLRALQRGRDWGWIWLTVVALSLLSAWWTPAEAATPATAAAASADTTPTEDREALGRALQRASDASIGVLVQAVEGSLSAETLGARRKGSGVVIGADGVVLTIGYLILEAERIDLVLDDGRLVPARALAYDLATGFGLVQALVPLPVASVPLGDSAAIGVDETLLFVSGGQGGAVSPARLLARGEFAGYWEYLIDGALITTPARPDHSGAGLYNRRGELVGIGSLVLPDARTGVRRPESWLQPADGETRQAGNLFVPVDLLKPILAELRTQGRSHQSARAWLGLNCAEVDGQVRVLRVNRGSPAEAAGLQVGDRILRLDGAEVSDLPGFYRTLWQGGAAEREVRLEIGRSGQPRELQLRAVDRQATLKRATGI
jgi:S1-C subfamily serine protease